jgi:hypothetical protein
MLETVPLTRPVVGFTVAHAGRFVADHVTGIVDELSVGW